MKHTLTMIEGMESSILGVDSSGKRVIYSVESMIKTAMEDMHIDFDKASDLILEDIIDQTNDSDRSPIYLYELNISKGEVVINNKFIGLEPKDMYSSLENCILEADLENMTEIIDKAYQCQLNNRREMIRDIKSQVDRILNESEGVDVMLDVINLLQKIE